LIFYSCAAVIVSVDYYYQWEVKSYWLFKGFMKLVDASLNTQYGIILENG